jgi:hypothetical protein
LLKRFSLKWFNIDASQWFRLAARTEACCHRRPRIIKPPARMARKKNLSQFPFGGTPSERGVY